MTANDTEAVKVLNQLIATCLDGENGYRQAADGVKIGELKTLLSSYSAQRARFAVELRAEVERLGGRPAENGSLAAALHRGWTSLKSLVAGHPECGILAECERGESVADKVYAEAAQAELPPPTRALLSRQRQQIQEALTRVRALEEACAKV